jgi:proline dehydrogenase
MTMFDSLVSNTIRFVPKPIVGYFSKPYIAGPRLEDAVRNVKQLNAQGICATIDVLGESVTKKQDSLDAVELYMKTLQAIYDEKLDANISVKPTHMGLQLDEKFCVENIERLITRAEEFGTFVRIDMEDISCTSDTLRIHTELHKRHANCGVVIQAYLRRTMYDLPDLIAQKANLRLCKGIYVEPRRAAYKPMPIVNQSYIYALEQLLSNGCYVGIATHDEMLVFHALRIIDKLKLKRDQYEFQMLLGVTEELRSILVEGGHRLRVYTPFGEHWYPYSVRRLKENPTIASHALKAIFGMK